MAVYQISRIQVRRGQANSGTGLPQLASGEMAWAIDTQQLYIGSGAVSEGAPAVSNIRVLTAQDLGLQGNLLGLAQYVYGSSNSAITTGPNANSPVGRTVNTRLDDQITTADFGALGDGLTDDTAALQRAINQLFLNPSQVSWQNTNSAVKTRAILTIPPGNYYTSNTLYIPSYTNLFGAGIDKTIINYHPKQYTVSGTTTSGSPTLLTTVAASTYIGYIVTCPSVPGAIPINTTVTGVTAGASLTLSNNAAGSLVGSNFLLTSPKPAVQFVNDNSTAGNPDPVAASTTTQARKIHINGLSITTATGLNTLMQLNSVRESRFENIGLDGYSGQTIFSGIINSNSVGIALNSPISAQTQDNIFRNIRATGLTYGVYSYQDLTHYCEIVNNLFENCYFANSLMGFFLGNGYGYNVSASPNGPLQTEITNTKFYYIQEEAVYIAAGTGTNVRNCKYSYVGNNGGTNLVSTYPQVYFATYGNLTTGDISDRDTNLANPNTSSNSTFALIPYVPVVSGHGTYSFTGSTAISLSTTSSSTQIFKLPLPWLSSHTVTPASLFSQVAAAGPTGQITYSVPYVYASTKNFTRQGVLTITADVPNRQIQLSDEYNFAGADANSNTTSAIATNLDFQAQFLDKNGILTSISGLAPWTIVVSYINTLSSDNNSTLTYTYNSVF
jgi:hypothetical protein